VAQGYEKTREREKEREERASKVEISNRAVSARLAFGIDRIEIDEYSALDDGPID